MYSEENLVQRNKNSPKKMFPVKKRTLIFGNNQFKLTDRLKMKWYNSHINRTYFG